MSYRSNLLFRGLAILFIVLCMAFISDANAEDREAPKQDNRAALQAETNKAYALFKQGDYEAAKNGFLTVYQQKQIPLLLFNIANCYRKLDKYEQAVIYYNKYLEVDPNSPLAEETKARIAESKALSAQQQLAADRQKNDEALQQKNEEAIKKTQELLDRTQQLAQQNELIKQRLEQQLKQNLEKKPVYKKAWFWAVIGGVVAVTAAVAIGVGVTEWQKQNPPEPESDLGAQGIVRF